MKLPILSILFFVFFGSLKAQSTQAEITQHLTLFYEEYFSSFNTYKVVNYSPQVAEGDKKMATLLVDEYVNFLNTTGHFNNDFLASERLRLDACKKDLAEVSFKRYSKFEMGQEPTSCKFFYFDHWTNAQDTPDGLTVTKVSQPTDVNAVADFKFYTGKKEDNTFWDTKGQAGFTLTNGEWLIGYINFE